MVAMLALALAFLVMAGQFAQTNTGELHIIVTDAAGLALASAVELTSPMGSSSMDGRTDRSAAASRVRRPIATSTRRSKKISRTTGHRGASRSVSSRISRPRTALARSCAAATRVFWCRTNGFSRRRASARKEGPRRAPRSFPGSRFSRRKVCSTSAAWSAAAPPPCGRTRLRRQSTPSRIAVSAKGMSRALCRFTPAPTK